MAMKKTSGGDSPPDLGSTTAADHDVFLEN
jgi:hypothetical protein